MSEMKHRSVYGIASTQAQAERIVARLTQAGFAADAISALFPDATSSHGFAHEKHTKAPEGAVTGVAAGGLLGGSVGLLAGAGAIAIPGLGALFAAGPILAALSGAAVGATVGGVAGALAGLGVPEIEAKRYEGKIRGGNILISVHAMNLGESRAAKEILRDAGAEDVCAAAPGTAGAAAPQEEPSAEAVPPPGTPTVRPVAPEIMPKDDRLI